MSASPGEGLNKIFWIFVFACLLSGVCQFLCALCIGRARRAAADMMISVRGNSWASTGAAQNPHVAEFINWDDSLTQWHIFAMLITNHHPWENFLGNYGNIWGGPKISLFSILITLTIYNWCLWGGFLSQLRWLNCDSEHGEGKFPVDFHEFPCHP